MRKILFIITLLAVSVTFLACNRDFKKPPVPTLVADRAYIFTDDERTTLEAKLFKFSKQTSVDILVYTTPNLYGYSIGDFGQRLGKGWEIGQKGFKNGIVIVYKENNEIGPGEITIQLGYGIEPLIPSLKCKQIIDQMMIPKIRKGYVYEGISAAVDECMALTRYNVKNQKNEGNGSFILKFYIVVFLLLAGLVITLVLALDDRYTTRGRKKGANMGGFGGGEGLSNFAAGNFGGASGSW